MPIKAHQLSIGPLTYLDPGLGGASSVNENYYTPASLKLESSAFDSIREALPDTPYSCDPLIPRTWKDSEMRVLVVFESINRADIRNRTLLCGDNPARGFLPTLLGKAFNRAIKLGYLEDHDSLAIGYVGWHQCKTYTLAEQARSNAETSFTNLIQSHIKKLKPTHILLCGDNLTSYMLPNIVAAELKIGWVFDTDGVKITPTLDIDYLLSSNRKAANDDDEGYAKDDSDLDMLYMVERHAINLFAGKMLYSIAHVKPNPILIDTIEKFNTLVLPGLKTALVVGLDCETKNLSSYQNAYYFIQLAFTYKEAYVIPLDHPSTPFNEEEIAYIKLVLKKFFESKRSREIVTFNGGFDLRVARALLDVKFMYHVVWEVNNGESLLDENSAGLRERRTRSGLKMSSFNLANVCLYYGNDFYQTAAFSKEDRIKIGNYPVDDINVLNYAGFDASILIAIRTAQRKRARDITVRPYHPSKQTEPESYLRLFDIHMRKQMSDATHAISQLEQNGSHVDQEYMFYLTGQNSPVKALMDEIKAEAKDMPAIKKANKMLVSKSTTSAGLFGTPFVFSFSKPEHKQTLFFDILKVPSVSKTRTGQPAIDKKFIEEYQDVYDEVELFGRYQKVSKLFGTYVKGWLAKLNSSYDSILDSGFRASYAVYIVVTGRLNSFGPNLQQIPSRGPLSKYIKRMFVSPVGCLGFRADYSAHEVRGWANIADDDKLAGSFMLGLKLRQKLVVSAPGEERDGLFTRLKREGDLHLINIKLLFGIWVDKKHVLRDLIKSTVFGLIYGMAPSSLGKDNKRKSIITQKEIIRATRPILEKAGVTKEEVAVAEAKIKAAQVEMQRLKDKDDSEFIAESQDAVDKMYGTFKKGKRWLDKQQADVAKNYYVMSPLGRRRIMYRALTRIPHELASAQRRGMNSPIQGMSSEIGLRAAYLCLRHCWEYIKHFELDESLYPKYSRTVHDANYFEVKYEFIMPFLFIFQWSKMYGVADLIEQDYGWKMLVPPEIEIELSAREDQTYGWDWTLKNLRECIESSLKDQIGLGRLPEEDYEATLKAILAPMRNPTTLAYLQEHYPLLGVQLPKHILAELLGAAVKKPETTSV